MAVILTGTEYIDLDTHGAGLDIRTAPLGLYAEVNTTNGNTQFVMGHGRSSGAGEYAIFMLSDGSINFRVSTTTFNDLGSATGQDDGTLHRVLGVFRPTSHELELWVDGAMVDSATLSTDSVEDDGSNTRIGIREDGNFAFIGQISNVAVWESEISSADAADLSDGTKGPADVTTGQLGHWPLDYDARDISGNSRDGTPINSPDFTEDPPSGTPYGRVTETETARALTASKAAAFGRTVEATLARAFGLIRAYTTGRATETETVRGFTAAKSAVAGRVTETETARAFGVDLGAVIGHVAESETARGFTIAKAADFSRVAEAEAARTFGVTFGHTFGRVTETEQARGFTAAKTVTFGRVTETETVRAYAGPVTADLNPIKLSFREPARHLTHAEAAHVVGRESRHVTYQEG